MPTTLTAITRVALHVSDGGVADVAVWFTDRHAPSEMVTFNCFDLFDYEIFCSRVLEVTGHMFYSREVEDAPDAWSAKLRWRHYVREQLEPAQVDIRAGAHWRPLIAGNEALA